MGSVEQLRAAGWGLFWSGLLAVAIFVGSWNLRNIDAALVGYTFACLFAAFAIAHRYSIWLHQPPTSMYWRRGWRAFLRPGHLWANVRHLAGRFVRLPDGDEAVSEFGTPEYAESIFATAREAFVLLDDRLRVRAANRAFYDTFRVTPAETEGRILYELGAGQWDIPALRLLLEEVVPRDGQLRDFEVEHDFPRLGRRTMLLNARRVSQAGGPGRRILLAVEDVTEKYQAREEARRLREELEDRVRQRTAELEAFSYSVSHDLRSPLRALDGFARILLEEYAAGLPAEGQEYVRDIRRNAQKMGQLIDDLLTFSRLGRQPLQRRRVAPAALVREVLEDLRPEREARRIEVVVGDLPTCHADPALLKQVWANLLGNAFKYTRRHDPARVEVGCVEQDGEPVYFVRDTGAGFDMRYAGKLFGVFQRLHKAADYDGTGVGLAIVQRVVRRHGGRVWAEAAVNRGATFYFTLPDPEDQP